MNTDHTFDELSNRIRFQLMREHAQFNDEKHGICSLENPSNFAGMLGWVAEGLLQNSFIIEYCQHIAFQLSIAAQDATSDLSTLIRFAESTTVDEVLNVKAMEIRNQAVEFLFRDIVRGVESSSNPLTMIISKAKVDAAKRVLEVVMGNWSSAGSFLDGEAVADVFAGRAAREEERARERAKIPFRADVRKIDGLYYLTVVNCNGEQLAAIQLKATRKENALSEGKQVAAANYAEHNLNVFLG